MERCDLESQTTIVDGLGEATHTQTVIGRDIPCRLVSSASVGGRERLRLEAIGQVTEWLIVLPWDSLVSSKDILTMAQGTSEGRRFNVSQVTGPHTDEVRRVCMVEEIS